MLHFIRISHEQTQRNGICYFLFYQLYIAKYQILRRIYMYFRIFSKSNLCVLMYDQIVFKCLTNIESKY